MARSKYSQAIHRSIKRQLDSLPAKPTKAQVADACKNAYTRVRTQPDKGDIPKR